MVLKMALHLDVMKVYNLAYQLGSRKELYLAFWLVSVKEDLTELGLGIVLVWWLVEKMVHWMEST